MKYLLNILWFVALVALQSCYDDKGNYDYHDLESVVIDTVGAGIQQEYSIMRFDVLHLSPKIYFEGQLVDDKSNVPLTYEWTIFSSTTADIHITLVS